MKNYHLVLLGFLLPVCCLYYASAERSDPFNSYRWNRGNVMAGNAYIDRNDWYEWWYLKIVEPESRQAFFFTYGVVNPWDSKNTLQGTKAVVQIGDFSSRVLVTNEFPLTQFAARYDRMAVNIGGNLATDKQIQGHLIEGGHEASWDLSVDRDWRFNAMGWATGFPELSGIYWYPAQASASISGKIRFDGRDIQLRNAPAYQDRNWGRSFPKWWTWLSSNHFKNSPGTAFVAGGGEPKVFNSVYLFSGLCVGLKHSGKEYLFRTTDADHVNFNIGWGIWNVVAENKRGQRIEISAYAPPDQFLLLKFQSPRGPMFYDYEALLGTMTIKVYERAHIFDRWHRVALLETDTAGIEWGIPEPLDSRDPLNFHSLFNTMNVLQ